MTVYFDVDLDREVEIDDLSGEVRDVPPPLPTSAACASCGISVRGPLVAEDVETVDSVLFRGGNGFRMEVTLTRCAVCLQIQASAADFLRGHPDVRQGIGDASIAEHRLECALAGLDALGVTDARVIDRLTGNSADVRRLIEHMTIAGGEARWVSQISPTPAPGVRPDGASVTRWGHVTTEQRNALRQAQVALGVARNERPEPVPAPAADGGACMLCGVAAWPALRSQRHTVWTKMSADPETIGGRPAPESIGGCVCPRCDVATERAGAVGMTAMGLSVLDYLGATPMNDYATARGIDGLLGWAVSGRPASAEPWAHVDLSALR